MRIESIMRRQVITASPTTTIGEALQLLRENKIRHLPVVEQERLVGILSDRDLREALPSILLPKKDDETIFGKPVSEIMKRQVLTALRWISSRMRPCRSTNPKLGRFPSWKETAWLASSRNRICSTA